MSIASHEDAARSAHAAWQQAVAGVLAKSRRVDVADLPADPEHLLDSTTYDGITVSPLYTAFDERPEGPLPGQFPYLRGRDPHRDVNAGWKVCTRHGSDVRDGVPALNGQILDSLANGTSALWLTVGSRGLDPSDLSEALHGVLLELAPLTIDARRDVRAAATALFDVLDAAEIDDRAAVDVRLGVDTLTAAVAGTESIEMAEALDLARACIDRAESMRAITVDGTVFHNLGASDAQELGASIAAGLEYVRSMTENGVAVSDALRQIEFRFAATDDQFQTIAKFRAARILWARIAQVCGAPDAGDAPQHAVTSEAMMSQRDPWVNMLRTTLASFGAGVGGADSVTVLPFDAALNGGAAGVSKTFAARIARNTQLLLLEEAHLGRVLDPGSGSWYIEELTAAVAATAWDFFQTIEASGGFAAATADGSLVADIEKTRAERESDIAHRITPLTGVNEFPNLAEAPLTPEQTQPAGSAPVYRYGRAFESLRDRSDSYLAQHDSRPQVLLVPLGTVAEHNVRTTFASNLLASGGIEAVNPGPLGVDAVAGAVEASGASIAVVCGTDKRYGDEAATAVDALRAAGVSRVLLAGPEKIFAGVDGPSRPDGFLTAKVDAVAVLTELLDTLGASK
ncbi:methylmalonyl-CoA mutase small subunit [Rhodococcus sp. 05-2254-5]|uniref:methylmalonyl-CoA mutase small subunit n=1 Tax=Nocardiaceae TaxID=85025 RepID=UPI000B9A49E9|nr:MULTISPECIES: methylmalonyl-CoA mutase small subunit [Rhodococcus]MDJ0410436.1 methylmalonyl-CoA mutase small subunit [Rhodococcus fascians]OZE32531.1 methylmalonyl-CoA mutase small subunit [Rhodococcus sp. 05-2254-5]OZE48685.1 methylmalonyl-CoA mutase small subunit [Rhodococcus sp. 05-2254-1]CAH0206663.1 putative methylmalonyl-CoA mutase small subunit [Rhodococcus fascians]